MNHLWSPWRMEYIDNNMKESGCAFCLELAREDGPDNLIITRGKRAFVILNRYPYTSGHIMVVPFMHVSSLYELDQECRAEIIELTNQFLLVLENEYHPDGFNVGMNLGEAAGAGIAEHLHMHIVPRWSGDTNFMTALAETRVLPEALRDTYMRLKSAWKNYEITAKKGVG